MRFAMTESEPAATTESTGDEARDALADALATVGDR
jgi:hypothetical protein